MGKEQKQNRIYLRATNADKSNIAYNANLLNISMSEYILRCVRRKRIVVCENFPELIFHLSRLGNNLNQIAVIANKNDYISEEYLLQAKNYLKECYELMNKLICYICEPENTSNETDISDNVLEEIKKVLEIINEKVSTLDKNNE